jgi:hypothetical protein
MRMKDVTIGGLTVGNDRPLLVIAGPCQLESLDHAQMIAGAMAEACQAAGAQYVFKASYDKANRTSLSGKRGMGMEAGLKVLEAVRAMGLPVLTDVHDAGQAREAATVVDVIQIPAFPVPPDRSSAGRRRNRGGGERQEGPVPCALGHGQRGRQGGQHRKRPHPSDRTRGQLRLQHAGRRHAQPADHGEDRLAGDHGCDPFGAAAGRAGRPSGGQREFAPVMARAACRWALRASSSKPTRIPTARPRTGRT